LHKLRAFALLPPALAALLLAAGGAAGAGNQSATTDAAPAVQTAASMEAGELMETRLWIGQFPP